MKISLKYNVKNPNKEQVEIINDLEWHTKKVMNMLLYDIKEGKEINADINGSLNILRKYIKGYIPNQEIAMDKGQEQRPIKKRVA